MAAPGSAQPDTAPATADDTGHSSQIVTFALGSARFGVPIGCVDEIALLGRVEPAAGTAPHLRGLMRIRERVVPLIDLRRRLGMRSLHEEREDLISMLAERRADHIRWLEALERSVREGVRFELATDPHKCAFGRWYDSFRSEDPAFAHHLKKFDEPHKRIHGIAQKCLGLRECGEVDAAVRVIEQTRSGYLSDMLVLFDTAATLLRDRTRELVLVVRGPTGDLGLLVDRVDSVTDIDPGQVEPPPPGQLAGECIDRLVKDPGGSIVRLLDLEAVVADG